MGRQKSWIRRSPEFLEDCGKVIAGELRVEDVAEKWGVSVHTVWRAIKQDLQFAPKSDVKFPELSIARQILSDLLERWSKAKDESSPSQLKNLVDAIFKTLKEIVALERELKVLEEDRAAKYEQLIAEIVGVLCEDCKKRVLELVSRAEASS